MAKKSPDLLDLEAICERVIWSLRLTPQELMAHIREHRTDALCSIPNPKNGGMIIIGREASDRFWRIAERHLAAHPEKKVRTHLGAFVDKLRSQFSEQFLAGGSVVDPRQCDVWIGAAYAAAAEAHEPATHFIPCGLIFSETLKQFAVGPVAFYHASEFFRLHGEEFDRLPETIRARHRGRVEEAIAKGFPAKNAATPEQSAEWGGHITAGLLESFKRYNWFSVVNVSAAHKEVSYDRALFTTRGALNIIKLLLSSAHTHRLRTADDHGSAGKAATLTRDLKGELGISLSTVPMDNTVGDGWFELLTTGKYFPILGRVLELCSSFVQPPPLCARLMDALSWFGDAVSEQSPAAKIVKFVTAIERICGTGKEKTADNKDRGVTGIIITRASILYSVITEIPFNRAKKAVTEIYECRSNLVHGSVSPFDDEIVPAVVRTDQITNLILIAAVDYYNTLGLENPALDEAGLRSEFLKLEQWNVAHRPNPSPPSAPTSTNSSTKA